MKAMAEEQKKMREQMGKMVTATESLTAAILELARARSGNVPPPVPRPPTHQMSPSPSPPS